MNNSNSENKSLEELYRQLIIHHAKKPLNFGKPKNYSLFANENSEFLYNKNNINDYKITYSNGKIRK